MSRTPLTLEELRVAVEAGEIDTVVLALVDMQGRLQGKRFHAPFFLDQVVANGSEGCNYLLAVDVDMNTVDGYAMSSWERGYGDFAMVPDFGTLRRTPWQPGSAMLLADLTWLDGTGDVVASPRQILRRQLDRLAEHGLTAYAGTELEFVLFRDSYEDAWRRGYRDLTPANQYNVDYSLLGTARVEPLLRRIRTEMAAAGLTPESAKGECNLGQHEIAFRYDEAVACADHHVIYKNGAKEIAAQEGMSITFMAKPNEREGNSCHIHFSLRDSTGGSAMLGDGPAHLSQTGQRVLAGLLATMREFSLLFAPNINSYKRYQPGSFAPTALRWGWTTAPARCGWSGTGRACGWRTGCPAPTSTRTWRSPAWSPARCTASTVSWSWATSAPATRTTTRRPSGSPAPCATPWPSGRAPLSPGRRSATRWWPTTPTRRGSSWPPSTRR